MRQSKSILIGYARVSTQDQTLQLQTDALTAAGCARIFSDVASGARTARPGLEQALSHLRQGDTLAVWRLDRLGRSLAHLVQTVGDLERQEKGFKSITEQIDTTTPSGRLVFHLFASLAQFERDLIRERVRAGITAARARGRVGGRPRVLSGAKAKLAAKLMSDRDRNVADICRALNVSRATLYRVAQEQTPPATTSAGSTARKPTKAVETANKAKTPTTPRRGTKIISKPTPKP